MCNSTEHTVSYACLSRSLNSLQHYNDFHEYFQELYDKNQIGRRREQDGDSGQAVWAYFAKESTEVAPCFAKTSVFGNDFDDVEEFAADRD